MTKSESLEWHQGGDAVTRKRKEELKKELESLVKKIAEDDDPQIENFDRASTVLAALRDLRCYKKYCPSLPQQRQQLQKKEAVPEHFLCPISRELMKDPVVLASGLTCDRPFIQARLNAGQLTCPQTNQVLSHSILTPNHLVHKMISKWCESQGIELPPRDNSHEDCTVTQSDLVQLGCLLEKICAPSISEQKIATKELRLLTKRMPSFRALLGERSEAIPQLVSLLSLPELDQHPEMQEDIVSTILNLSIHDNNKKIVGDNPQAIPLLIDALKTGTMVTRSNAAAALFTLSAIDSNKCKIGELGAMKPLVDLLEQGGQMAKKDAASAIFNLCMASENKGRAVREGAVRVLMKTITDGSFVDESLAILATLASNQEAAEEVGALGGVPVLLSIIRENTCGRNRENSAVILYCITDRTKLREIRQEENLNKTISQLAQNGSSRARRKAAGILDRLKRIRDHDSV